MRDRIKKVADAPLAILRRVRELCLFFLGGRFSAEVFRDFCTNQPRMSVNCYLANGLLTGGSAEVSVFYNVILSGFLYYYFVRYRIDNSD